MKKVSAILALVGLLLLPGSARADYITMFSGLGASGTFGCSGASGVDSPCDLTGYTKASFQATSAAGSVATVTLQVRNTPSDPWSTVFIVTNPGTGELGYSGPGVGQCQVVVAWASGSLTGTLVRIK